MNSQFTNFFTAAALATGLALAQTPAAPHTPAAPKAGHGRQMMRHRMAKALGLTADQKQQAKAIFQQAKQEAQPVAQQLKQNRETLAAAIKANNVSQIQTLSAQQGNLRGQALAIRSEAMAKFYGTLTPDQKAKADQIRQRIKNRVG